MKYVRFRGNAFSLPHHTELYEALFMERRPNVFLVTGEDSRGEITLDGVDGIYAASLFTETSSEGFVELPDDRVLDVKADVEVEKTASEDPGIAGLELLPAWLQSLLPEFRLLPTTAWEPFEFVEETFDNTGVDTDALGVALFEHLKNELGPDEFLDVWGDELADLDLAEEDDARVLVLRDTSDINKACFVWESVDYADDLNDVVGLLVHVPTMRVLIDGHWLAMEDLAKLCAAAISVRHVLDYVPFDVDFTLQAGNASLDDICLEELQEFYTTLRAVVNPA